MLNRHRKQRRSKLLLHLTGIVLFVVFIALQVSLWGESGLLQLWDLSRSNASEFTAKEKLKVRNDELARDITDLKQGVDILEERAREDLGMIKLDETFFRMIESDRGAKDTVK